MASKGKRDPNFPMQGKQGSMGGQYGSKSTNLSAKQLKAAGAAKAAKKRTVSINQTRREGSRTLGPKGKPLTGTVTLADGSTAVYKNGRRVQAADARKPAARPGSGSGNGGTGGGGNGGGGGGGDSRTATQRRQQQNKNVMHGKIKVGANGKSVRRYNAKTGRWDLVKQGGNTTTSNQNQTGRSVDPRDKAMAGRAGVASQRDVRPPRQTYGGAGVEALVGFGKDLLPGVSAGSRSRAEALAALEKKAKDRRQREANARRWAAEAAARRNR